ncbi:hypothetical protein ACOSQ3_018750 [Xanthoceras sorbifolium]
MKHSKVYFTEIFFRETPLRCFTEMFSVKHSTSVSRKIFSVKHSKVFHGNFFP